MKILLIMFLLIISLAFSGCASTHKGNKLNNLSDEQIAAYNSNPKNTDKIVCKTESNIGTRIPKRVCHKESEINQRTRSDQQSLQKIQSGVISRQPGGD